MRFRKRITFSRFFRFNISKTGISATVGPPGLSVNIGKKGTYLNTGIPGTGIYDRNKLDLQNPLKSETVYPIEPLNKNVNVRKGLDDKVASILIKSLLAVLLLVIISFVVIMILKAR